MSNTPTINNLLSDIPEIEFADSHFLYGGKAPGLALLIVSTRLFRAVISVQGAQLLEFIPANQKPLLWLSPNASFEKGQAIRGGIPICLPWFGVAPSLPEKPKHGFVRTQPWELKQADCNAQGQCTLKFLFDHSNNAEMPYPFELYPYKFAAELELSLSQSIKLSLEVHNLDKQTIPVSQAFHSYHPVDCLTSTQVLGLENKAYLDNTQSLQSCLQHGAITFSDEVDRVYENINSEQIINTRPAIAISGENCPTAIVWNPGAKNAATMTDIGESNQPSFICVERGAAFSDSWCIPAGKKRMASIEIKHMID